MNTKTCPKCKQEKKTDDFAKNKARGDGLHSWCKMCKNHAERERWAGRTDEEVKEDKNYAQRYDQEYNQNLKQKVIDYYSKKTGQCSRCGEGDIVVLCIDHINGGGNEHRRDINRVAGRNFYQWLVQNNYPDGFQVLCCNCNMRKRWERREYGGK